MLAETLGVDVEALIAANKEKYKGIKPASRLMEGTVIIVPAGGKAAASSAPVVAAEHDGVALHLSYTNSTGYLGVRRVVQAKGAVFVAEYKRTTIGRYEAAVDAAVAFANKLKEVEAADEAAAEEARAAAAKGLAVEADGVTLLLGGEPDGVPRRDARGGGGEGGGVLAVVVLCRSARLRQARPVRHGSRGGGGVREPRTEGEGGAGAGRARGGGGAAAPRRQRRRPDAASGDGPAAVDE